MTNYPSANPGKEKTKRVVAGILLLNLLVLGNGSIGFASETHPLIQIQQERITGVLTQVPLRTVLEQLQEKLAIEYVVPREELDRPISANLVGETVPKALSKILAPWDYALQIDQQGRVRQVFVVAKMRPIEIKENVVKSSEFKMATFPRKKTGSESILRTSKARVLLSGTEMTSHPERDAMASSMFVGPSEKLPQMVIQPPQRGPMNIQPSSTFMQVIPASGYPPMDILPVSEDVRRDFFTGHN